MDDNKKNLLFPARIAHLDICHNCTHGGDMVMKCNCPELQSAKDWHKVLPHEYFHIERVRKIRDIAEVRGLYDFSPTPFLAVIEAVDRGECAYFKAIR